MEKERKKCIIVKYSLIPRQEYLVDNIVPLLRTCLCL